MAHGFLSIKDISYIFSNSDILFEKISLNINPLQKAAILGSNGVGKSTLLKLIAGEIAPSSGDIIALGTIFYLSQNLNSISGKISEVLGVSDVLLSLQKVYDNQAIEDDYDIIGYDWDIEQTVHDEFVDWGIPYLKMDMNFSDLSGGEKEKILLISAFLSKADILLFDEPTNNLDLNSKKIFIEKIKNIPKTVLIVSHDRSLLREVDVIYELKPNTVNKYSGNYDFYIEEKNKIISSMSSKVINLKEKQKDLTKTKTNNQTKADRSAKTGKRNIENGRFSRIDAGAKKGLSDISQAKRNARIDAKYEENSAEIKTIEFALREDVIKIPVPEKPFIRDRIIEIKEMKFSYGNKSIFENFNLSISGGERVLVRGDNGSGKTTLIKLIMGELEPSNGFSKLFGRAVYLNQNLDFLDGKKTLLENIMNYNKGISKEYAHSILANFGFRNELAQKNVEVLSGGELLKMCLATILGSKFQSDILILDEPTNNLDIKSIEILESALRQYQGAIILISHDEDFISNVGIERSIFL